MRNSASKAPVAAALLAMAAVAPTAAPADTMNISQFVFRDLNRNGIYDRGEHPWAGVPVSLIQNTAAPVFEESNLAGFANFPMSADTDEEDALVTAPGPLSFLLVLPVGTELTTGSLRNESEARLLDGSPSGMIIDPPLQFIGVAPSRTISTTTDGVASVTCGEMDAVQRSGAFQCNTGPGTFDVTWTLDDGSQVSRSVTVGDWGVRVPLPTDTVAVPASDDTILTFEDIITSENIQEFPSGDAGLTWHNLVTTHRKLYGAYGYVNGTVSGQYVAYTSSGHMAEATSDEPFDFIGMYVSVAWPKALRGKAIIEGLRDGEVVARDSFTATNLVPVWFDAGWSEIDALRISHEKYWQVVVDDIRIGTGD